MKETRKRPTFASPRYSAPRVMRSPRRVPSVVSDEGLLVIKQLIEARYAAKLTQVQVAQRMGVSQATLSAAERGAYSVAGISATFLVRYARVVGLQSIDLGMPGAR